ncbi:MAG: FtsX-like permease family protein [Pseudomonadota bacterium]
MTVVLNAWVMIREQNAEVSRPSGLIEADTFHLGSYGYSPEMQTPDMIRAVIENDLREVNALPGVIAAAQMNTIPLSGSNWGTGVTTMHDPDNEYSMGVSYYLGDENTLTALGVELIAGEDFTAEDVVWQEPFGNTWPPVVIVTKALGARLFRDVEPEDLLGRTFKVSGDNVVTIKGVLDTLQSPASGNWNVEMTMVSPQRRLTSSVRYMVRTEPGERDRMMPIVEELLRTGGEGGESLARGRLVRNLYSMEETRRESYNLDIGLNNLLSFVMIVLLLITALGTLGLASFSVTRRTKQIGIRRALGASEHDIRRYFLLENLMISGFGVVLGSLMTVGFNVWLVDLMNFPKIDWWGIPLGIVCLLLLGQVSVWGPANRACQISPASATRTV